MLVIGGYSTTGRYRVGNLLSYVFSYVFSHVLT